MMCDWRAVRRTLWLMLACTLLLAGFASAAEPSLTADFDGDGLGDRAMLDRTEPSVLRIWLSTTNATATIRSQTPIIHLAATDLDGDRRSELIAGGRTGLRVWTKKHRDFRSYRPHHAAPDGLASPDHRTLHDTTTDSESAVTGSSAPTLVITSSARPRAPSQCAHSAGPEFAPSPRASLSHPPFAPRSPPPFA